MEDNLHNITWSISPTKYCLSTACTVNGLVLMHIITSTIVGCHSWTCKQRPVSKPLTGVSTKAVSKLLTLHLLTGALAVLVVAQIILSDFFSAPLQFWTGYISLIFSMRIGWHIFHIGETLQKCGKPVDEVDEDETKNKIELIQHATSLACSAMVSVTQQNALIGFYFIFSDFHYMITDLAKFYEHATEKRLPFCCSFLDLLVCLVFRVLLFVAVIVVMFLLGDSKILSAYSIATLVFFVTFNVIKSGVDVYASCKLIRARIKTQRYNSMSEDAKCCKVYKSYPMRNCPDWSSEEKVLYHTQQYQKNIARMQHMSQEFKQAKPLSPQKISSPDNDGFVDVPLNTPPPSNFFKASLDPNDRTKNGSTFIDPNDRSKNGSTFSVSYLPTDNLSQPRTMFDRGQVIVVTEDSTPGGAGDSPTVAVISEDVDVHSTRLATLRRYKNLRLKLRHHSKLSHIDEETSSRSSASGSPRSDSKSQKK